MWALLPGFCACARDVDEALPGMARLWGVALAERPAARGHVLQGLSLLIMTARSRKTAVASSESGGPDGGSGGAAGGVRLELTADATAALETVGRFGKNFLPLLFNVHQAEPPEKRPTLQEAVRAPGAAAHATPPDQCAHLVLRALR